MLTALFHIVDKEVEQCLIETLRKCQRLGCALPTTWYVDNCCSARKVIVDTLKAECPVVGAEYVPVVAQDIIHLKNRFTETTSKAHPLYLCFNQALAKAITVSKISQYFVD